MAVEYVITSNADRSYRISGFAHSLVPTGNNIVGFLGSSVLVEYLPSTVSQAPSNRLPGGRQGELDTGTMYEWPFTVEVDANASNEAKQAAVETWLVANEPAEMAVLANRLGFWGEAGRAG